MPKSWLVRNAEASDRARRRIELTGITPSGHPVWDRWEVAPLVAHHPDYSFILPMIDRRTKAATYGKAGRLGITKPRMPPWSVSEIIRLRKIYPRGSRQQILDSFPGRSYTAVTQAANKRKIYRVPKAFKPTGCPVLDQILQRARQRSISLEELGREARDVAYFVDRKWRGGRFRWRAHWLAIKYLGGTLRARWPLQGAGS